MKRLHNISIILSALAIFSCARPEITDIPAIEEKPDILPPTVITAGLNSDNIETKLSYEEVSVSGRKSIKTFWSEGDELTANASPSSRKNAYKFHLIEGAGTGTGVFECTSYPNGYAPGNFTSNAWTMYYPGNIENDTDFLNFRYSGQVQTGNNSLEHLKDYHSIRLTLYNGTDRTAFNTSYIDFSGNDFEESGCMKFNIKELPSGIIPTKITLSYISSDRWSSVFSEYNTLHSYFGDMPPKNITTNSLSLNLEGFGETSSVTAYMMLSNADINVSRGGRFKVMIDAADGSKYSCVKPISSDVTLKGGRLHSITCTEWKEESRIDGFYNPDKGIFILQEAEIGNGTDIIIMGDGFAESEAHFGANGDYETIMKQAYDDFFSIEPYKSLKPYFNVYYINAVSEDDHDAIPYKDKYGNQNGATQGSANTVFSTSFSEGSTHISGDINTVIQYAAQAIRTKGGKGGTPVTDEDEVYERAYKSLSMVMINVPCYAGTCNLSWSIDAENDFGNSYSVAFTSLGNSLEKRRLTTIHEAGGHGFGKLADEYGGTTITSISDNSMWIELEGMHSYGVNRNINQYNSDKSSSSVIIYFPSLDFTSSENVYWSDLLKPPYNYSATEGLGFYEGADTYENLFCRPTENSVMRSQFGKNGQFFNAISRWAIWYRLMRLTGGTAAGQFKESLEEFARFDSTIEINYDGTLTRTAEDFVTEDNFVPTAPPVMIKGRWENGRFITID